MSLLVFNMEDRFVPSALFLCPTGRWGLLSPSAYLHLSSPGLGPSVPSMLPIV